MNKWPLIQSLIIENSEVKQLVEPRGLTPLEMDEIQKNIRRGAKDIDQNWASAIELTKKAYDTAGQTIPNSPSESEAWDCLLTNIEHAVNMLSKYRGTEDQTWRISDVPDQV